MTKHDFPKVHFYDQDFVDVYNKSWAMLAQCMTANPEGISGVDGYFATSKDGKLLINQIEAALSSFFLVYSNRNFVATKNIDYFYSKQEADGAIRAQYDLLTGGRVEVEGNPDCIGLPLFAWAEFNLYHRSGNKKRLKEVLPILCRYMDWISTFKKDCGLYHAPMQASLMMNSPRHRVFYPVDFNAAVALSFSYLSALGEIMNDKDISFKYKRAYFSIKTRINSLMWSDETTFYHDLDEGLGKIPTRTIATFFPLLAEVPNADKAELLTKHLQEPESFGTSHPFPTLEKSDPSFCADGEGFRGSVYPLFNFIVIKGLEKYQFFDIAREAAISHLYYVLDAFIPPEPEQTGDIYEAYKSEGDGPAVMANNPDFPQKHHLVSVGLSTIALMIENVVGLTISLPKKTVDWVIPNLEVMGIENLSLKRNLITIQSNKTNNRGWEIQMESEKLYYFTINILGNKKKTLPIPSGKCSMLIDKI